MFQARRFCSSLFVLGRNQPQSIAYSVLSKPGTVICFTPNKWQSIAKGCSWLTGRSLQRCHLLSLTEGAQCDLLMSCDILRSQGAKPNAFWTLKRYGPFKETHWGPLKGLHSLGAGSYGSSLEVKQIVIPCLMFPGIICFLPAQAKRHGAKQNWSN